MLLQRVEIKNKLTETRGEVGRGNGREGEGFLGTSINDTWTKPKGGGIEVGGGNGWGWENWRQL